MKPFDIYIIKQSYGIYEIVRINDTATVVQTNIRTLEKALQSRKEWQRRELAKYE
jgi:hypothetical protein